MGSLGPHSPLGKDKPTRSFRGDEHINRGMLFPQERETMAKFVVTSNAASIGQMIAEIKSRSSKLQKCIPICAASCVFHAVEHGNVTPATQLCDALGAGMRVKSLRYWFFKNGPFGWDKEKQAFNLDSKRIEDFKKKVADEASREAFIKVLETEPIWDDKAKGHDLKEFELSKELAKLLKKAEKKGQTETPVFKTLYQWKAKGFEAFNLDDIPTLHGPESGPVEVEVDPANDDQPVPMAA